jgi:predicted transcriptional regulator
MSNQNAQTDFLGHAGAIVAAYVTRNPVSTNELPILIQQVHEALTRLATGVEHEAPVPIQMPAVPIKRSYTADAITCLECGLKFKTLKRHLTGDHNLRPDQYRAKWKLPDDYPMVAPSYSQRRSDLAKAMGLGRPSND